jgi:hypothetical protein
LYRFQDLIRVSDLDQPLEKEPISYFRADIAVFTWTIPF